jgi:carbamoyltransferase
LNPDLARALASAGYREAEARQLLGVVELSQLMPEDVPAYFQRCQVYGGPLALWVCLWQLHQRVPRPEVEALVSVEGLLKAGFLLEPEPGILEADVDLTPCEGVYVFTDQQLARRPVPDRVYQLGIDSLVLARVTPHSSGRALDLCTGSGIQALVAARSYESVIGVDLNPKALGYARINAQLNGLAARCRFIEGDLYAAVKGERYELITANPPFVPSPDLSMDAHRTGGESGEEISQRLVAGLSEHLAPGGTFSMVLDYPILSESSYLGRLQRWAGGGSWGIAVLGLGNEAVEPYIRRHIDPLLTPDYTRVYQDYLESYRRQGIAAIGFANVFIRRLPDDHPGFAVERSMAAIPRHNVSNYVEDWLTTLTRQRAPGWEPDWDGWRPIWTAILGDVWLNRDQTRGILDTVNLDWSGPLGIDGDTARLVARVDGLRLASELAEEWSQARGIPLEQARREVKQKLAWLCEALVCR